MESKDTSQPRREKDIPVHRDYLPGFTPLVDAFRHNFERYGEVGASLCLYHGAVKVVDIWAGAADPSGTRPWEKDTLSLVFSATKAASAVCVHLLADSGIIDLDSPVAAVWPEFGAHGKERLTLRMVLDHRAGLPVLDTPLKRDCLLDHGYMAKQIAAASPRWTPGSRTAYHPLVGGFIIAEVVRRVTGRTIGQFFACAVARPLGLDFAIGIDDDMARPVSHVIRYTPPAGAPASDFSVAARQKGSLQHLLLFNHGDWAARGCMTDEGLRAEIAAAGGVTNARGLAGLYAALRPGGPLGLSASTIESFSQVSSATHRDASLLQPTRFGPGFMARMDNRHLRQADSLLIGDAAFGHVGAGGSIGFRDPALDISLGYVMNRMGAGFLLNERGQALVDAAYRCVADTAL